MKEKSIKFAVGAIVTAFLLWLDQWTKMLAETKLVSGPFVLWDGVFEFHYTQNRGAAFGILQNQRLFFVIITCVIFAAVVYVFLKIPNNKKYLPMNAACILVAAGALGNFIDRIYLGYVIDFLYFKLINFPIFNVADCYITVACFGFAVLVLFYYRDEDFAFLKG